VFIPKSDGRQRPLGVPVLEDKIVQRAVGEVLNAIHEEDFLGFSYGFRPGRSPHQAVDALTVVITTKKVNWVLDADLRSFFDTLTHAWLVQFIEHRVADRRIGRLIRKWLAAGVLEEGKRIQSEVGTVQGGSISPLLANIYLHYVFDLWVQRWRSKQARGDVIVVRFADDFVVGFQHRVEAERFMTELVGRLWWLALRRRSQGNQLPWPRMQRVIDAWLPPAHVCHPYPLVRLGVTTQGGAGCGNSARPDLWRGAQRWAFLLRLEIGRCF
jgi:group II intron reverse transcriptase/maturase